MTVLIDCSPFLRELRSRYLKQILAFKSRAYILFLRLGLKNQYGIKAMNLYSNAAFQEEGTDLFTYQLKMCGF